MGVSRENPHGGRLRWNYPFFARCCAKWMLSVCLCVTWLLASTTAHAIDPTEVLSELHHTQWTTQEGAPPNIYAIAQTNDGYLWLGSEAGLYQFDGVQFNLFSLPDGSQPIRSNISALYTTAAGELWIGMRFGGVFSWRDGHLTFYGEQEGLPHHTVWGFAQRDDGTIWATTVTGLYRLEGNKWRLTGADWRYPASDGYSIFKDRAGTLWLRSQQGTFYLPRTGHAFIKSPVPGGRGWFYSCSDGEPWVSDSDVGLLALSGAAHVSGIDLGGTSAGTFAAACDRDGGLWLHIVHEDLYLLRRIPNTAPWDPRTGVPNKVDVQTLKPTQPLTGAPTKMFEDAEGNMWITTDGGLDRFRRNKLHAVQFVSPMHRAAMTEDRGHNIWLANDKALLEIAPGSSTPALVSFLTGSDGVTSLWSETDGSILLARAAAPIARYFQNAVKDIDGVPNARGMGAHAIFRDGRGKLWVVSIGDGLYQQDHGQWLLNGGLRGLPRAPPLSLLADGDDRLWFGYPDNQVALIEKQQVRMLGSADGLSVGVVQVISGSGDRIWVGGTNNVSLYSAGHFWVIKGIDGYSFTGISGIVQDENGAMWLNGNRGITHISASEISAFLGDHEHRVQAETLNYEDGLEGIAVQLTPIPTVLKASDGRIWFTTSMGVYWIDPAHIPSNPIPPPVIATAVVADGRTYPVDNAVLPVRTDNLEIDFTAPSLSIPNRVQFRYKLDGVDRDWINAGARRQAYYTYVPFGTHRFHVIAANEDGVWNHKGAIALIVIPPAFYQTNGFYLLCGVLGVAALWQLYRFRVGQLAKQTRGRLGARLEERERIARELHDTLLQSAQGLILLFQGFAGRLSSTDATRGEMESALDHADRLLNEARDRVGDLRSTGLDTEIAHAISRVGAELFSAGSTGFKVLTTGTPLLLSPIVADDICRIVREALTNALRHAGATHIEVEIAYETNQLRLRVRDDGKGIDPEVLHAGTRPRHFGLQGMRERARHIDAILNIWSRAGAGTEIELLIPAAVAYRESPAKPRWIPRFLFSRPPTH
jgi:signal transduction histidine kinase/ligand-binding sensor domain-containing protein